MRCDEKRHGGRYMAIDLGIVPAMEVGSTKYEPVMFDMDPFGGKKDPCTRF